MRLASLTSRAWVALLFALLTLIPAPAEASDFSGLAYALFGFLAAFSAAALVLAAITNAIICWYYGRRMWLLLPGLAVLWFAILFGSWQIWMEYLSEDARRYRNWKPPKQPVPAPAFPQPEGVEAEPPPDRQ